MKTYGLIGEKLSHSYSQNFFDAKFKRENLTGCEYLLFEIEEIQELPNLLESNPELEGFNVTIPYKESIIPFLTTLDITADNANAVNTVKVMGDGSLIGYNTDYPAFRESLKGWLGEEKPKNALVLGSGGASKAVSAALKELNIKFQIVSRKYKKGSLTYSDLKNRPDLVFSCPLIINTTPLGMYPNVDHSPELPYHLLSFTHYLYDLIYNPEMTLFLEYGNEQGAQIKNGIEMLERQANLSWEIWNI